MPLFRVRILITLRPSILDPQGKAVRQAAAGLGVEGVEGVRIGKVAEVALRADTPEAALALATTLGERLLANPVMEDFSVEMADAALPVS